jgi:sRNA-binding protein
MAKPLPGWLAFRGLMLPRLAEILGCDVADVPYVFKATKSPRVLKVGIHHDLLAAYPGTDRWVLWRWLRWWTRSSYYVRRLAEANNRHGLDGIDVAPITERDKKHARRRITKRPPKIERRTVPTRPVLSLPPKLPGGVEQAA